MMRSRADSPELKGPPRSDVSDRELAEAVLAQASEHAFQVLYARHTGRLYWFALRMVDSPPDAQDVVQETWLRAMMRLRTFEWRSTLGTWLMAIAANVARETLEHRGRWDVTDELDDLTGPDHPLPDIDLERAIARLPAGSRTALLLHDVEGFTHEEIAAQLGWSAGTSKSQLFRARRALRRMLGERLPEEKHV